MAWYGTVGFNIRFDTL